MFIGHFGLAYASKRVAPRSSLATLFAAASFVDILWPIFLLFGWETVRIVPHASGINPLDFVSYPYSHSLLMGIVWGIVFAGIYWLITRMARESLVLGALVLSHWFLDLIVHVPDLPLYPGGSARVGLGLWNSLAGTLIVEGAIFVIGLAIYLASTRAMDWKGIVGTWLVVALLVLAYLGNVFGSPPPNVTSIVYAALIGTVVTLILAWWADRHRYVIHQER